MPSSKDKGLVKQYAAQDKYEAKMKAAGMKQIRVWVPCGEENRVKVFAAGLRKPHQFL